MPKTIVVRYGPETPVEVYSPENPPPGGGPFLKLDQTTPQHVINGAPQFDMGITIKKDQYIYLDGA